MPPSSCHGGNASHARPRDEWWERATRATHRRGVRLFILIWRLVLRQVNASSSEGTSEDRGRKPWAATELRLGGHRDRGEREHCNDEAPHRVKTTLCAMDFLNKSPFDCTIAIHPLVPWLAIKGFVVSYGYTEHSRQHHADLDRSHEALTMYMSMCM